MDQTLARLITSPGKLLRLAPGFFLGLMTCLISTATRSQAAAPSLCPNQLPTAINRILDRANAGGRWGVMVQTLAPPEGRQTLYQRNAKQLFTPASNVKLLTTAAALRQLGADFRIRTSVYQVPNAQGQVILRVVGRGDPSLTDAQLNQLAQQLQQQGIRQIDQLWLDNQYFRGPAVNSSWEPEDLQAGYGAPANALVVNQNAIAFTLFPQSVGQPLRVVWTDPSQAIGWKLENRTKTVGAGGAEYVDAGRNPAKSVISVRGQLRAGGESEWMAVSVPDPVQNFGQRLRRSLTVYQIAVNQVQTINSAPITQETEVATVASPTLAELLVETNRESNNLFAEALLRTLGAQRPEATSTVAAGLSNLKTTLTTLGVTASGYELVDGSGLSRRNRVSPEALIQTLQGVAALPEFPSYQASLAVGGVNGTLRNRFRNPLVAGKVQAKSGYISGVTTLSGYLQPLNYDPVAFSVLVNQTAGSPRSAIDEIVMAIARLRRC